MFCVVCVYFKLPLFLLSLPPSLLASVFLLMKLKYVLLTAPLIEWEFVIVFYVIGGRLCAANILV